MAVNIQLRRGTAAEWTAANPTLAVGEIGIETDTDKFKIGNGTDDWDTRPYGGLEGPDGIATATAPLTYDSGTQTVGIDESAISIAASQISDLTATAAELNILDGVTATTAELNYVDGVTSDIQTQLDSKAKLAPTAFELPAGTGSYTISSGDSGVLLLNADALTVTIDDVLPVGAQVDFLQNSADQITFVAGSGVTLNSKDGNLKTAAQYSPASVKCVAAGVYVLVGDLGE